MQPSLDSRQVVFPTVPDPGRADLMTRYEAAATRKLEKLARVLDQWQRTRQPCKRRRRTESNE